MADFRTLEPEAFTEKDFRAFVDYLFQSKRDGMDGMLHAAVGLAGESGEVLDIIKKSWVYDKPLDREKLQEEMGDVIHYLMMECIKQDWSFSDLICNNVKKLRKRYPDGFTKEAAVARADVTRMVYCARCSIHQEPNRDNRCDRCGKILV